MILSRANTKLCYPASFQLVAAMNPCPCGFLGDPNKGCRCSPDQLLRYTGRVSGPLLDRIDLFVTVPRLPPASLLSEGGDAEPSADVRARVTRCRELQQQRQHCSNARLDSRRLHRACQLGAQQRQILEQAATRMHLSGRALHRVMRVARTIADMAGCGEDRQRPPQRGTGLPYSLTGYNIPTWGYPPTALPPTPIVSL